MDKIKQVELNEVLSKLKSRESCAQFCQESGK